jgi:hypothetical protein
MSAQPTPDVTQGPRLTEWSACPPSYGNIAERTVYRWADEGLICFGLKLDGRRLWRVDEIDRHIKGGCKPVRAPGRSRAR